MSNRSKVGDFLAAHPSVDWTLAGIGFAAGILYTFNYRGGITNAESFLLAAATLGALVMAVATFSCALMYQSSSRVVTEARSKYADQLKKNWLSIFSVTLIGSGALVVFLLFPNFVWMIPIGLGTLLLMLAKGVRAAWWMYLVMILDGLEQKVVPLKAPPPRYDRNPKGKAS